MKMFFFSFFLGIGSFIFGQTSIAATAQDMMGTSDCLACHQTEQPLVGPPFREIAKKYSAQAGVADTLTQSVKNGSVGKWGAIPMPPHPAIPEAEIKKMIEWILALGTEGGKTTEKSQETLAPTKEEIQRGLALFQGTQHFVNGGPTCNSCHHVKNDAVIGGGILARELTTVFSRMSGTGVMAILGSPPFPVMEQAYKNNPLTEVEIQSLAAFLEEADKQHSFQKPRDYGMRLLTTGIGGAISLFALLAFVMPARKKRGVYDAIFERQKQEKS